MSMTITLLDDQVDAIYREVKHKYRLEDVMSRLAGQYPDAHFDASTLSDILAAFDHALGNDESYYEAYWLCLDYAIESILSDTDGLDACSNNTEKEEK